MEYRAASLTETVHTTLNKPFVQQDHPGELKLYANIFTRSYISRTNLVIFLTDQFQSFSLNSSLAQIISLLHLRN